MKASNRVIINTGILYGNMVVNAIIALMSTRWILEALGAVDYGIYNLVGGIIAMFSFLNIAMIAATQRFLSYSIGKKENDIIRDTFKCSVILHFIIGLIVLVIFELLGDFFLHNKLQIPADRIDVAMIVLHCISISTFFTVITVPYQAFLNAMENMIVIAAINIYESVLKLAIAIILLKYAGDRLILYSVLMMCLFISGLIINRIYCWRKYEEVRIRWRSKIDITLFRNMFSFAGWNFIGSISSLLRNQGLAMLMNTFFGVVVNAAYGIATQVNGQAQFFSRTIIRALQPQIVKSEGAGNRERMLRISLTTCKIPFLMLSIVVAPLIAEMAFVLNIWLDKVPDNTIIFCDLILLVTLMMQIKMGLAIAIESVGKIKWYQIICGGLHFIVLPIAYYLYTNGHNASWGLIIVLAEEIVTVILTSLFASHLAGINLKQYYFKVFFPSIFSVSAIYFIVHTISAYMDEGWLRICFFTFAYAFILCTFGYLKLLNDDERAVFKSFTTSIVRKIRNR